jgi:ribosomal protein L24E
MAKCTYCENDIPKGTGMIYVHKNGKISNFCAKKCEKHTLKLKRKARDMKWVTSTKK